MAGELQALVPTGLTLYAVVLDSAGQVWNGTAFVAINSANWATYDIALTESTAGIYLADLPALDAGIYTYNVYERAGATPAITDVQVGNGWLNWDGSAILPLSTIDGIVDSILVDTGTTLPAEINAVYSDVMNATVEGTYTVQEVLRIMAGALAGKLSGGGTTTLTFRDLSDTLDRITATVNTTTGDRTAVTIDKS